MTAIVMFMIFLVTLGSLSMMQCNQRPYFFTPYKIDLSVSAGGPITIIRGDCSWPRFVDYTSPIDADSDVEIKIAFMNDTGRVYPQGNESYSINFCKMLDTAIDDPKSYEATLRVPESLGLHGQRCPIEPGKKSLIPHLFTRLVMFDNSLDEGYLTYVFSVERGNETLLKLEAYLKITYFSSWGQLTVPPFKTMFVLAGICSILVH